MTLSRPRRVKMNVCRKRSGVCPGGDGCGPGLSLSLECRLRLQLLKDLFKESRPHFVSLEGSFLCLVGGRGPSYLLSHSPMLTRGALRAASGLVPAVVRLASSHDAPKTRLRSDRKGWFLARKLL